MEKNWLIRSKKNLYTQIVGPVSRAKILELKDAQVLSPEVELCSGNGYWFWIKETDLFEKYVIREEQQEFNPISEAKIVLTASGDAPSSHSGSDEVNHDITMVGGIDISSLGAESSSDSAEEEILPDANDLEYPDMGGAPNPMNVSAGSSVSQGQSDTEESPSEFTGEHLNQRVNLPDDGDLEYPDMGMESSSPSVSEETTPSIEDLPKAVKKTPVVEEVESIEGEDDEDDEDDEMEVKPHKTRKKKKENKKKSHHSDRRGKHQPKRNDKLLLLFAAFVIGLLLIVGYFYLKNSSLVKGFNKIVPVAYGQEVAPQGVIKKKLSPCG